MKLTFIVSQLCLFSMVLATPIAKSRSKTFDWTKVKTLFAFGDSYTTQNFNITSFTYPGINYTSSGGPNWIEYLVKDNKSIKKYWNLAYGGATISASLVPQYLPTVVDLTTQIETEWPTYFDLSNTTHLWKPKATLFIIWIGINDIGNEPAKPNSFDATLIKQYFDLIEFLYSHQARNFLFLNVPPTNRAPLWVVNGASAAKQDKSRIKNFNAKLAQEISRFSHEHPDVNAYLFNTNTLFNTILDHWTIYGFKNMTGYCPDWSDPITNDCDNIYHYFWYNSLHPTYPVHSYLAEAIDNFLKSQK